jgi:hypothetical protein
MAEDLLWKIIAFHAAIVLKAIHRYHSDVNASHFNACCFYKQHVSLIACSLLLVANAVF